MCLLPKHPLTKKITPELYKMFDERGADIIQGDIIQGRYCGDQKDAALAWLHNLKKAETRKNFIFNAIAILTFLAAIIPLFFKTPFFE